MAPLYALSPHPQWPCVWQVAEDARAGDRVATGATDVITGYLGVSATARPRRSASTTEVVTHII